jgi:hypothetical protein
MNETKIERQIKEDINKEDISVTKRNKERKQRQGEEKEKVSRSLN